jgi:hypothetical protein
MTITTKTNGYELTMEFQRLINAWTEFCKNNMKVKAIELFYYGDKVVFADCILENGHYGCFNMTQDLIHFYCHSCTDNEKAVFEAATYNDYLFSGKIAINA